MLTDENASWDMVSMTDLWEDKHIGGDDESDPDGFVLVKQEDIVEGIACFMAKCLLSLKQTKVCHAFPLVPSWLSLLLFTVLF